MTEEIKLPVSHIKDLLRNGNDVYIGSDSVEKINELLNHFKKKLNKTVHEIMSNENRQIIQGRHLHNALSKIGISTQKRYEENRLTKADMRRILDDPERGYSISEDAILILQNDVEHLLREIGNRSKIYLQIMDRKTINAEAVELAYKGLVRVETPDYARFLKDTLLAKELSEICGRFNLIKSGTKAESAKLIAHERIACEDALRSLGDGIAFTEIRSRMVKAGLPIFSDAEELYDYFGKTASIYPERKKTISFPEKKDVPDRS